MDTERSHKTTSSSSSTSEFFICFTSRLSSSSMKLSSKCILSPSRGREPSSLSTSISRRLRNNGSIKGGQASPMFPTGSKKKGTFENPEPSSPKVTCIGQVRVKTKKQGKKMRARSKRRNEASFRRTAENNFQVAANSDLSQQNNQSFQFQNHQNLQQECLRHRNQRWVHLPLTICEALRAFGAEFSCLFPCRSSCISGKREKEKMTEMAGGSSGGGHGRDRENSCGAAFGTWLVALQDGDTKGRNIELVVGEEEEDRTDRPERSQRRRHVFEDLDIDMEKKNEEFIGEEEEKGRVSICIPPKNALLLMRCRSDPVKMAALANRFWGSPVQKDEVDEDEQEHAHMEEDEHEQSKTEVPEVKEDWISENEAISIAEEEKVMKKSEVEAETVVEDNEFQNRVNPESNKEHENGNGEKENVGFNEKDEISVGVTSPEVTVDLEKPEFEQVGLMLLQEDFEKLKDKENDNGDFNERRSELSSTPVVSVSSEPENTEPVATEAMTAETSVESTEEEEKETAERHRGDEEISARDGSISDPDNRRLNVDLESKERENHHDPSKLERESSVLPDCLLLMMCEPKLSMEVSKETWVCSADFIRWLPEKPAKKKDGAYEPKKRISIDSKPPPPPAPPQLLQPPRSSCSFPVAPTAGMSMANVVEQKLVGSNGYEPFVLTRCKSEPMRSSAKLAPDACFWKNRKLEPHRSATLGAGATGVGF